MQEDNKTEGIIPTIDPPVIDPPAPTAEEIQENNIQYVGKYEKVNQETGKTQTVIKDDDDIPTWRRNGSRKFKLPDGAIQKEGFYHKDANFLLTAYPQEFKRPTKKG